MGASRSGCVCRGNEVPVLTFYPALLTILAGIWFTMLKPMGCKSISCCPHRFNCLVCRAKAMCFLSCQRSMVNCAALSLTHLAFTILCPSSSKPRCANFATWSVTIHLCSMVSTSCSTWETRACRKLGAATVHTWA